jgi:protein involved in polysaccharide export with SLBB domain
MQQQKLDETITRLEQDLQRSAISRAQNVVSAEEAATVRQQTEAQQALIVKLKQIKATGRIVLEVAENAEIKDIPDLALEDGDRLLVPSLPSTVSVFGSVYNQNAFVYKPGKRISDYLHLAGGVSKDGDNSNVYVIKADGSVISKYQTSLFSSFEGMRVAPGDSIVVPEELEKFSFFKALKDYSQIIYQLGLGAAAIKVLQQ